MDTPRRAKARSRHGRVSHRNTDPTDCGPLSTPLCCLIGGAIVGAVALFSLPRLISVTRPFGMLSSTVLASLLLLAWMFTWVLIEYALEARYGCLVLNSSRG